MTVLYSFFSGEGVVFAADSMLTTRGANGRTTFVDAKDPKIFRVPNLSVGKREGLLGYFGCAEVGGQRMATWLRAFVRTWSGGTPDAFADQLWRRVLQDQTLRQRRELLGFHLAAFERVDGYLVPGFWFVRNGEHDQLAQKYVMLPGGFQVEEQLRKRAQVPAGGLRQHLRLIQRIHGMPWWFRNGDLPAFFNVTDRLKEAIYLMKQEPGYRVPTTLDAWGQLGLALVECSCRIAKATYAAGAPTIGGRPRAECLEWP